VTGRRNLVNHLYTMLALDIARDRTRDAEMDRRAALATAGLPSRPGIIRRGLANGLALVSRSSATAVRRLDDCVADDLSQALATK
jgi:hypothetical protein